MAGPSVYSTSILLTVGRFIGSPRLVQRWIAAGLRIPQCVIAQSQFAYEYLRRALNSPRPLCLFIASTEARRRPNGKNHRVAKLDSGCELDASSALPPLAEALPVNARAILVDKNLTFDPEGIAEFVGACESGACAQESLSPSRPQSAAVFAP